MPKLEAQPRLTSVGSDVIEWARRVVAGVNQLIDAIGSIRTGTSDITTTLDAPAFAARLLTIQTVPNTGTAIVLFDTKDFDTAGAYSTTTGRFTPQVAGYYQVNGSISIEATAGTIANGQIYIYKNGAEFVRLAVDYLSTPAIIARSGSGLIQMNGTTDYLQLAGYANQTGAGNPRFSATGVHFSAHLARRA
jgi:C1q domain